MEKMQSSEKIVQWIVELKSIKFNVSVKYRRKFEFFIGLLDYRAPPFFILKVPCQSGSKPA